MRSMTAFGRATGVAGNREITVELRSVNNRFLDLNVRLPRAWAAQEEGIKATLGKMGVSRGKVDVSVTYTDVRASESGATVLEPDLDCARRYVESAALLARELGIENDLTVTRLMSMTGVMMPVHDDTEETDEELRAVIEPILAEACAAFLAAREREGERLGADVLGKLAGIRELVATIAARSEDNVRSYRARFEDRLRNILQDNSLALDEQRILTECAVYADRVAIDEELVRLASHMDALEALFRSEEPVGRRIDFMLQETNREINTIGSKCADAAIARVVADVKSEFEKIREQIQNIE